MWRKKWNEVGAMLLLIVLMVPVVWAATTATTTFVFNVSTSRAHTVTYGASCSTSAFFYNEIDANYDPDVDGNASRVRPSSVRRPASELLFVDYNFVGNASPADRNTAYDGTTTSTTAPSNNTTPSTELAAADYSEVSTDDTSYQLTNTGIANQRPSQRFVFKLLPNRQIVRDINFIYVGQAQDDASDCTGGAGTDKTVTIWMWNYATSAYDQIAHHTGTNAGLGSVSPSYLSGGFSADTNVNITNYISVTNQVTVLVKGPLSGSGSDKCLFTDLVDLKVKQFQQSTQTFCQSATMAPMTITNTGNVDVNIDGNFTSAISGADINVALKVWRGSDSGCGVDGNGLGGWQEPCGVTTILPEARWEFDDVNTTNFTDSSGNGHTGTFLVATPSYDTTGNCYDGNCLFKLYEYDMNVENNITFLDNNFTLAAWYYFDSASTLTNEIISTANGTSGTNQVVMHINQSTDSFRCQASNGSTTGGAYDGGTLDDAWHHLACTRKTDGNVVAYIDGAMLANGIQTTGNLNLVGAGNALLSLSRETSDDTARLDRTEIYTRALDANEVLQLYTSRWAIPTNWRTTAPTQTTCRLYDWTNGNIGARLIIKLPPEDTNQLCFSGEFNVFVSAGDHNKIFQTGSEFS